MNIEDSWRMDVWELQQTGLTQAQAEAALQKRFQDREDAEVAALTPEQRKQREKARRKAVRDRERAHRSLIRTFVDRYGRSTE